MRGVGGVERVLVPRRKRAAWPRLRVLVWIWWDGERKIGPR